MTPRADEDGAPAAVVIAHAPRSPAALAGLAPLLDRDGRAVLQALLIRRAAAWAVAAAPGAASVAVAPGSAVGEVAALLPAGATAFAQEGEGEAAVAAALARAGGGPTLIASADCPRLGAVHAAGALADLGAGCDVVFGFTLDGGWYLAGVREPRPDLIGLAQAAREQESGIGPLLGRARALGAVVGMLRHERTLATPGDAAALLADPLLAPELRAALSPV